MMKQNLEKLMGKGFRTDICKVKMFKGYWLQGKIVDLDGEILTVEVKTYYRETIQTTKVNVKDIIKIKNYK